MSESRLYRDRREAGQRLAERLLEYRGEPGLIVLGLPRGGVPVAFEVARALGAPLDVCLVRKLPTPGQPELAMGALGEQGVQIVNEEWLAPLGVTPAQLDTALRRERAELERRAQLYRGERPPPELRGRTAIAVDDGLATGASMRAALAALRSQGVRRALAAAPVGAPSTCAELRPLADALVCPLQPPGFDAVGRYYVDFTQTSDAEVRELLERAARECGAAR